MGTKFKDFGTSFENFNNDTPNGFSDEFAVVEEEKLLEDSKAQLLKNVEKRERNRGDAQMRSKKALALNISSVDWSGFSGAAHKKNKLPLGEGKAARRPSCDGGAILPSTADLDRRRNQPKKAQSLPARRSRRHLISTGVIPIPATNEDAGTRKERRGASPHPKSPRKSRSDRKKSESQKHGRRATTHSAERTRARTQRSQADEAHRKSLSPSAAINAKNRNSSASPTSLVRRSVSIVAAASSTTLDTGKDDRRRSSHGSTRLRRRPSSRKGQSRDESQVLPKSASDLKW